MRPRLLLLCCAILFSELVSGQTWESVFSDIRLYGEWGSRIQISDNQNGFYHVYNGESYLRLREQGELESFGDYEGGQQNSSNRDVYDGKLYQFKRFVDSIQVTTVDIDGAFTNIIDRSHNSRIWSGNVISEDLFCSFTNSQFITYDGEGEVRNTITFPRNATVKVISNVIYIWNGDGLYAFDTSLKEKYFTPREDMGGIYVRDIDVNDEGELFYIGTRGFPDNETGAFTTGKLDIDGNFLQSKENFIETTDFNAEALALAVNGDAIGVSYANIEVQSDFVMVCMDAALDIVGTREHSDSGPGLANIVTNNAGGFLYMYNKKADPMQSWTDPNTYPTFVSCNASCGLEEGVAAFIRGRVFLDENGNGIYDESEPPINDARIILLPDSLYTYTDKNGQYTVNNIAGSNELDLALPQDCFSGPASIQFRSDTIKATDRFDFALSTSNLTPAVEIHTTSGRLRCNELVPFWITVKNIGCTILNGALTIQPNQYIDVIDETSLVQDITLTQTADESTLQVYLMASEEFVGEEIEILYQYEEAGFSYDTTFTAVLKCAVDPNDKQVSPFVLSPDSVQYGEFRDELIYNIRFQNEGNDLANKVTLVDTLSDLLDINTFRPLHESHKAQVEIYERVLTVSFEDIQLPAKQSDESGSQGHFTFAIKAKQGLPDFSEILNTAEIYFDFNDPIITNTTTITLKEYLDEDADQFYFWEDCDDLNSAINPNAQEIANNEIDEDCSGMDLISSNHEVANAKISIYPIPASDIIYIDVEGQFRFQAMIYDLNGQLVKKATDAYQIRISDLPPGTYILELQDLDSNQSLVERLIKI